MITNTVGESDTKELLLTLNNPENGSLVLTCDTRGRKDVNTDCTWGRRHLSKIIQQQSEGETQLEKSLPLKDMDLPKEESNQQSVLHGYGTHNSNSDIAAQQP